MKEYVGREATDGEVNAFLPAIRGAASSSDFDAQQFTIDWVKLRLSGEVGTFQAATNYYDVVMQVLGRGSRIG